jgi:glycosyltransferase involved in cell wall biosynthesis
MAKKPLRIALHDSNRNPMPPEGIIQAIVGLVLDLATGLKEHGHDVHLYAAAGSKSDAKLESKRTAVTDTPIYDLLSHEPPSARGRELERTLTMYEQLTVADLICDDRKQPFDVIHINRAHYALAFAPMTETPILVTIHDEVTPLRSYIFKQYSEFSNVHFAALSNRQRELSPELPWRGTVYNGIDVSRYAFNEQPEDLLMYAGRIVVEKGPHLAIDAARATGFPIELYGNKESQTQTLQSTGFWDDEIEPRLSKGAVYKGLLPPRELAAQYGRAKAVLLPITWEEPFGLVSVEAMAAGTPVIAFRRGAFPEIIVDGVTGFLVDDLDGMIEAVKKIDTIDRAVCRRHVEEHFSVQRMVEGYETLYSELAGK